jgi:hypothetical protein
VPSLVLFTIYIREVGFNGILNLWIYCLYLPFSRFCTSNLLTSKDERGRMKDTLSTELEKKIEAILTKSQEKNFYKEKLKERRDNLNDY